MKKSFLLLASLIAVLSVLGQDPYFRETYVYEGYIQTDKGQKLNINLNFLILLDSTIVGSYHYQPSWGPLKLVGTLFMDNSFELVERSENDSISGYFHGKLSADKTSAAGFWLSAKRDRQFDFAIAKATEKSYWDYIRQNRSLHEYHNLDSALRDHDKVLSIDVPSKGLHKLPKGLAKLHNIISINLLGNDFHSFPTTLTKLTTLDEISLSTNKLTYVGPEIGKLKNLRILIMNFNSIKKLPKEIGDLRNLLYLEIGNNRLERLPEEIKYLTSLQELHIDGNNLSESEKERIKRLLPNCVIYF